MSQVTYRQWALDTNGALQANVAVGGERERQARHALAIAEIVDRWYHAGSDDAFEQALTRYHRYCDRIDFDPMQDFPSN